MVEDTQSVSDEVVEENSSDILFNAEDLPKHNYTITEFDPKTDRARIVFPDEENYTVDLQIPRLPNNELLTGEPLDTLIRSLLPVKTTINRKEEAPNASDILALVKSFERDEYTFTDENPVNRLNNLRIQRDILLNQSDWTVMPDSPLPDAVKKKWILYRKELRDLPQRYANVDLNKVKIEYPTPPEG